MKTDNDYPKTEVEAHRAMLAKINGWRAKPGGWPFGDTKKCPYCQLVSGCAEPREYDVKSACERCPISGSEKWDADDAPCLAYTPPDCDVSLGDTNLSIFARLTPPDAALLQKRLTFIKAFRADVDWMLVDAMGWARTLDFRGPSSLLYRYKKTYKDGSVGYLAIAIHRRLFAHVAASGEEHISGWDYDSWNEAAKACDDYAAEHPSMRDGWVACAGNRNAESGAAWSLRGFPHGVGRVAPQGGIEDNRWRFWFRSAGKGSHSEGEYSHQNELAAQKACDDYAAEHPGMREGWEIMQERTPNISTHYAYSTRHYESGNDGFVSPKGDGTWRFWHVSGEIHETIERSRYDDKTPHLTELDAQKACDDYAAEHPAMRDGWVLIGGYSPHSSRKYPSGVTAHIFGNNGKYNYQYHGKDGVVVCGKQEQSFYDAQKACDDYEVALRKDDDIPPLPPKVVKALNASECALRAVKNWTTALGSYPHQAINDALAHLTPLIDAIRGADRTDKPKTERVTDCDQSDDLPKCPECGGRVEEGYICGDGIPKVTHYVECSKCAMEVRASSLSDVRDLYRALHAGITIGEAPTAWVVMDRDNDPRSAWRSVGPNPGCKSVAIRYAMKTNCIHKCWSDAQESGWTCRPYHLIPVKEEGGK